MQVLWSNAEYLCQNGDYYLPKIPMHWYDTMILTRVPAVFYQLPFGESNMERKILVGVFEMKGEKGEIVGFSVNCLHLESMDCQKIRIGQLRQI